MQPLQQTLEELRALHEKVFGLAAPPMGPQSFLPFPPGVDPVEYARSEAKHLVEELERAELAPKPSAWIPAADTFVGDDAFVVRIELPGVSREDVHVHVVGRECVVRGERKPPQGSEDMRPLALERPWGLFERRFLLPEGSSVDTTKARYVDGMLEVNIPVDASVLSKEQPIEIG